MLIMITDYYYRLSIRVRKTCSRDAIMTGLVMPVVLYCFRQMKYVFRFPFDVPRAGY